jgi:DtxR family Mn-dependent transcriptional regulator
MTKLEKSTERVLSEDALKHIYKCAANGRRPTVESVAGALQVPRDETTGLLNKMVAHHLLELSEGELHLTPVGLEYALHVIRAHRLWERYLADETGYPEDEWHDRADRLEHSISAAELEALSAKLGHPIHDPHGDPIPGVTGEFVPHGGQPLPKLSKGQTARIVHLEDEPPVVYAQLVAEGLHPGMDLLVTEVTPQRIRFMADGEEHLLAPMMAANISVELLSPDQASGVGPSDRLSDLKPGQSARVTSISPTCRGLERRRFMDLGILPGTVIKAEMVSPSGDPTAYLVRGTLIGLRQEQAALINITRELEPNSEKKPQREAVQ